VVGYIAFMFLQLYSELSFGMVVEAESGEECAIGLTVNKELFYLQYRWC